MFMKQPKNPAIPVTTPRMSPMPTASSPNATMYEKTTRWCITKPRRNAAYQPCTAGLAPVAWPIAPSRKPFRPVPACAPVQAALPSLSAAAWIHS